MQKPKFYDTPSMLFGNHNSIKTNTVKNFHELKNGLGLKGLGIEIERTQRLVLKDHQLLLSKIDNLSNKFDLLIQFLSDKKVVSRKLFIKK